MVFLAWWMSGAGDPPGPRGGDGERACQRCASLRHASRPLTWARWSAGLIRAAVVLLGAARWASRKDTQPSGGLSCLGPGGVCRVGECAESVRCSFLLAEGGVEPAASDSKVVCYLLWCRLRPRFRRWACCSGGRELWVWEMQVMVLKVEGEKDVRAATFKPPPLWRRGGLPEGRGALPVAMAMVHA